MRRTNLFLAKTSALFGVPAIALAQSKTTGTPTIPTGPAVIIEAAQLSGTITASAPLGSIQFTLTKWETASTPTSPTCTAGSSTTTSKSGSSTTRSYTQNLTITKSGFSFDEKVNKTVLCAEQIAGVVFDTNIPAPTSGYVNSLAGGTTTHYASSRT